MTSAAAHSPPTRHAADPAAVAALAIAAVAARRWRAPGSSSSCWISAPVRSASNSAMPIIWRSRSASWSPSPPPAGRHGRSLLAGLAILALAALANAGLGAYHAGVEWQFWQGPTDCSGPVADLGSAGTLLQRLDTVKVIRCDEVQWRFLGLSLAGYNVLISLLMAAIAAWGMASAKRA